MKLSNLLNWKQVVAVVAGIAVAGGVMAMSSDMSREAIAERIKPVAKVRLAGDETAQANAQQAAEGGRTAEQVYNQACAACHTGGVLGAPRKNVAEDWTDRLAQGMDVLLEHSINGFNAMPPRGGCMNCTDEEIESAIEYMIADL
ncbi:MAG: cytochrome c5 family protein [Aliidiomarina sp.]|uniref:c-type cytochrome n=1 Tax=Aliidiomarina sp. TaxID=1872439 RepID=UPI0025BACCA1|nr:cytochrome c5 family protein [Aliidiomarina sp.]MCH8501584.1 cytochrome c5 family protein [Aliidiomarina sp.]MCL5254918.1 cytochrome c5 family protein [Gammaproteobacteria bacterium]